jgi:hypothetical protein
MHCTPKNSLQLSKSHKESKTHHKFAQLKVMRREIVDVFLSFFSGDINCILMTEQ